MPLHHCSALMDWIVGVPLLGIHSMCNHPMPISHHVAACINWSIKVTIKFNLDQMLVHSYMDILINASKVRYKLQPLQAHCSAYPQRTKIFQQLALCIVSSQREHVFLSNIDQLALRAGQLYTLNQILNTQQQQQQQQGQVCTLSANISSRLQPDILIMLYTW